MGVSVNVVGLRTKDGKWDRMMAAKKACQKAGISYPQELYDYFGNPANSEVTLWDQMHECGIEGEGYVESGDGFIFEVKDIPEDVYAIRVYMSH